MRRSVRFATSGAWPVSADFMPPRALSSCCLRLSWTILVVSVLLAAPAAADDTAAGAVQHANSFWAAGPAGGAFGLFIEGGVTAGQFGFDTFAAASLGLGVSLRWFEASVIGYGGSSFDGNYNGGAFLAHVALRVPVKYVAFTLGTGLGYVEVPGHYVSGVAFEPSVGLEIDPVCHLRIGLLGGLAQVFAEYAPQGILRGALTVGYVMGRCRK